MPRITLAIAIVVSLFAYDQSARAQGWSPGTLFRSGTSPDAQLPGEGDPFLAAHSTAGPVGTSSHDDDLTWVTLNRENMDLVDHSESYGSSPDVGRATFSSTDDSLDTMENHALQDVGYSTLDLVPQEFPPKPPAVPAPQKEASILDLIMKPAVDFRYEPITDGFGVTEFWGGFQIPVVPAMKVFSSPPPMVTFNFGYTDLHGIDDFYSFAIGLDWYRPINDQWAWFVSVTPMITTDFENTSSDMWRVKANAFAFYTVRPDLRWSAGVLVTGRSDIPILPLIGVTWWPNDTTKFDINFPRPRIYHLLGGDRDREQWFYVGGELGGGTWAYQLPGGFDDELTYRAYRLAFGIEFVPAGSKSPTGSASSGNAAYLEGGLSFGRNLSLDKLDVEVDRDSTFYLGGGLRF